jgi:hypothetical protein
MDQRKYKESDQEDGFALSRLERPRGNSEHSPSKWRQHSDKGQQDLDGAALGSVDGSSSSREAAPEVGG